MGVKLLLCWIFLFAYHAAHASDNPIFTEPDCQTYEYVSAIKAVDGKEVRATRGGLFCTVQDFPLSKGLEETKVGSKLFAVLQNKANDPILTLDIADYIFSDERVASEICKQFAISPFSVKIYTQFSPVQSDNVGIRPKPAAVLSSCLADALTIIPIGCPVFSTKNCPVDKMNTMHLKLIEVKHSSGKVSVVVSSGNIGRGIYANLEDWLFFEETGRSTHKCAWETLEKMASETIPQLSKGYTECRNELVPTNGNNLMLMPFEADSYYRTFHDAAMTATEIYLVTMDFSDRRLAKSLASAIAHGAKVSFIASSDWYYARLLGFHQGNAEPADIDIAESLRKKYPDAVSINFVETNYYGSRGNNLHHKFALFLTKAGASVLMGSTNMNRGAITKNLDSAYFIKGDVAESYRAYTKRLITRTISSGAMPTTKPRVLGIN